MVIGPVMTAAQTPEQTNAQKEISEPRIRLIWPYGGDIRGVEFLDSAGNVKKKIDSYAQYYKEDGKQKFKELKCLIASHRQARQGFPPKYILVMESDRMDPGTLRDIHNTITLYDQSGNALFQKTNLECYPVALSANSGISACLISPPESEDWVFLEKDAIDKVLVFSQRGEVVREIIEPVWQVQNVKISPSGNWLAYYKQLERLSIQVVLINLNTGKKVALPVTDDRTDRIVTSYQEVLDNGDLMGYEEIPHKGSSGRWESVPRPKILYKMGP
jgi:hypothetical protein